jgi:hypothetical protein
MHYDKDAVQATWVEPPKRSESCPRCKAVVDTTTAYPFISGFPPNFDSLKKAYEKFAPEWEYNRQSFERYAQKFLEHKSLADCEALLNSDDGSRWYRQRMFYRSTTAFYRSLQLFLSFLTLDRHCYHSWAKVTAYYSRFYFIQAFLNLILSTYLNIGTAKAFFFFDGTKIVVIEQKNLSPLMQRMGSHDMWWSLMEALKSPDYPCENVGFILSRLVFNPEQRQTVNYDYEYLGGGFIELEWFDSGAKQMLSHFMPRARPDEDITDINRFFEGYNPENVDPGDFYADEAQIIWCSLIGYLQLVKALDIKQTFVQTETIGALSELHIGKEYPRLLGGIVRSVGTCLQDSFDIDGFEKHYASSEYAGPFFKYW